MVLLKYPCSLIQKIPTAGCLVIITILYSCTPSSLNRGKILQTIQEVDSKRLNNALNSPGDWITHGLTYSEQRYSQLKEIHSKNITDIGLAWSLNLGTRRGLEATPLVVEGIMYISGPWGKVFAIDARKGELIWKFDPKVHGSYAQRACCDIVNRGIALYQGKVYVGALDGRLIALAADTGEKIWEKQTVDTTQAYTLTGAPRVVKGKVIIGNSGGEYGVRGYVSAYDAESGELVWRFYTVPGNPKDPFENSAMALAAKTWKGEWWKYGGGGTVWDAMAYDPELDQLYIGTGNGSPWNQQHRSPGGGDNLFLSSILSLNPANGNLIWYYQTTPGDSWDFTATQHMILADIPLAGKMRKVLMQAPKNGFFYVIDRMNGKLLSAEPYVYVNWASKVDLKNGKPQIHVNRTYQGLNSQVFPSPWGGHNWQPMAYNPETGWVYIPARERGMTFGHDPYWTFDSSTVRFNTGVRYNRKFPYLQDSLAPSPTEKLIAWDPIEQKEIWSVEQPTMYNGGVLATAGNLIFQGSSEGIFAAYDATTGKILWSTDLKTGIIAPPISYEVDGKQYVSIAVGWGGAWGTVHKHTEEIYPGTLYTFVLGGEAPLPAYPEFPQKELINLPVTATEQELFHGMVQYGIHCKICHGTPGDAGGNIPNLAWTRPEVFALFEEIVLEGLKLPNGMPQFQGTLSPEDVYAIKNHILATAQKRGSP
ncbi:MAG: PQQ-dependent dehydrogenase, methanol/ethanol family [Bacteroidota bacterium]